MKTKVTYVLAAIIATAFSLTTSAIPLRSQTLPKEYLDSVKARYGINITVPEKYVAEVLDETTMWSLAENGEYGNPMWDFYAKLTSKDGNCMILLESVPAYNEKRILSELKNKTKGISRELSYILDNGEGGFLDTAKIDDYPGTLTEYSHSRSRRLFGADKVYTYAVPQEKTAFCYTHPSVDETEPAMQKLFREQFPEMRRFFFIKDGYVTYSLTMLLSSEGVSHEKQYIKDLRKIVCYEK